MSAAAGEAPGVEAGGATRRLRRLRGVTWRWREGAPAEAKGMPGLGVIAQDVEAVWPELIEYTDDGHMKVAYDGLLPPLMTSLGELIERMDRITETVVKEESLTEAPEDEPVTPTARDLLGIAGPRVVTELDPDRIEKVYPDLVYSDASGDRVVAYHGLVGPLIEAVKELDARLTSLEGRCSDAGEA